MEKYLSDFNFTIGKTYTINQHGLLEEIKFIITLQSAAFTKRLSLHLSPIWTIHSWKKARG
jgi:hypothetical protein